MRPFFQCFNAFLIILEGQNLYVYQLPLFHMYLCCIMISDFKNYISSIVRHFCEKIYKKVSCSARGVNADEQYCNFLKMEINILESKTLFCSARAPCGSPNNNTYNSSSFLEKTIGRNSVKLSTNYYILQLQANTDISSDYDYLALMEPLGVQTSVLCVYFSSI